MSGFFFVAAGGALGAAGRYAVSLLPYTGSFPVLTLCIFLCRIQRFSFDTFSFHSRVLFF